MEETLKNTTRGPAVLSLTLLSFLLAVAASPFLCVSPAAGAFTGIPRPLTVSIDDCGWQGGASLDGVGGPWRMGSRDATLADYEEIIRIAQNAKTRVLGLWILSELDRSNICAKPEYNMPGGPSDVTEFGTAWDNSAYVNDGNFALMELVRANAAWIEFGLHGVRHEHWEGGVKTRAEFGNGSASWGWDVMDMQLKCFVELMRQYYDANVCSFPRSFVPPAHCYYYSAADPETTGAAVHSYGVKYIHRTWPWHFDNGALCMDRDTTASPSWSATGVVAGPYPAAQSWVMTHGPNFFGAEAGWTTWLQAIDDAPDRYLPKNTAQAYSQFLYREYATINDTGGTVTVDNTGMVDDAYTNDLLGTLVLKTALSGEHVSAAAIDKGAEVVGYYEDGYGYGYLVIGHGSNPMGRLSKDTYTVSYTLSPDAMPTCVDLTDATFNVFSFAASAETASLTVEMYGTQDIVVRLDAFEPAWVGWDSPGLTVNSWDWNASQGTLTVNATGTDIQGETGRLTIADCVPLSGIGGGSGCAAGGTRPGVQSGAGGAGRKLPGVQLVMFGFALLLALRLFGRRARVRAA